jgi:hypothetical protein
MSRWWLPSAAFCALAVASAVSQAAIRSQTTCPAANPFDAVPDHVALQACLDDYDAVLLEPEGTPGYVGYLVGDNVKLRRNGVLLTTSDSPRKATIRAAPELGDSMLRASGFDNFEISFIRFDGNREQRTVRDKPCTAGNKRNVELTGRGFRVRYVESFGAVCGSAMTVGGSQSFEVSGSLFYDNGRQPEDAGGIPGLWSDGLTVLDCRNSVIRDNAFWDNTDIDLAVNGGASCSVYRNTISHARKYAFAGLAIGDPSRSGGEFSDNRVSSALNLLGFGIIVGCHPWSQCSSGYASNLRVYNNRITGAVVNLAIDGLNGGSVWDNTTSGAQGDRVLNCPGASADYTLGHAFNVGPLQSGFVVRIFDFGSNCQQ